MARPARRRRGGKRLVRCGEEEEEETHMSQCKVYLSVPLLPPKHTDRSPRQKKTREQTNKRREKKKKTGQVFSILFAPGTRDVCV